MALCYVRVVETNEKVPTPVAICFDRAIDQGESKPQVIHGHPGEMLKEFERRTAFWTKRWTSVPVGVNLEPQMGTLWHYGLKCGVVQFGRNPWDCKPRLDLLPILALMNANAKVDSTFEDVPPMFYGLGLERLLRTRHNTADVVAHLREGNVELAHGVLLAEHRDFLQVWTVLKAEMPAFRKRFWLH